MKTQQDILHGRSLEDVAEAAAHGGSAGDILMWLKCDEILVAEKVFTLWSSGYPLAEFCVTAVEPEEESAE